MPGFNQRGPMNEGPMTGWKRGACTGTAADDQGFVGTTDPQGYGRGMGRGRGNTGRNSRGCQAPGRGMGYGRGASPAPTPGSSDQDMQNRVNMLEAELSAIKDQLKNQSE